jgi:manganese/iron transport system substrate-binding protein
MLATIRNGIYINHPPARLLVACLLLTMFLSACASPMGQEQPINRKLRIVATTTIVSDVVKQVGADKIELTTLLPSGVDPHAFDPDPQDIVKIADADIIFANGVGLETFLNQLLESAGAMDKVVYVSEGIQLAQAIPGAPEPGHPTAQSGNDPHVWTNPNNVSIWVNNVEKKLSSLDPQNAAIYQANAKAYQQQLKELDSWIREQVAQISQAKRVIVSDHLVFTYFDAQYGFTQVGALIPGYSTMAEPNAQDIANLEDTIRKMGVKAIFVGKSVNPALAERVAQDTGTHLVFLYTGSLSTPGGEADSYLAYMRYDVSAVVNALK